MFTFIVINFCWWNLVLNISLKRMEGLGWNFIFGIYLCNTLCQKTLKQIDYHSKKVILSIFSRLLVLPLNVYIHRDKLLLMESCGQHILDGLLWNFIFKLHLCNTMFQQYLEKNDYHLKKNYVIYSFAPSCPSSQCLHSLW